MKEYITDIGLEIHIELNTKTKIFCGCKNSFNGKVNAYTCPVCTGMPGALPILNEEVVRLATMVGLATNCSITRYCKFDRKNYFYPDNPQDYQISQLYLPICKNGFIEINNKKFRIFEIHMEEDAGKLIHDDESNVTLINYNRSGVPLIEIVTMPDMSDADEVVSFLQKLKDIVSYLKASDCKLNEGSMRVDVNLSVREKGCDILGTRTEMKNLNSFKAIRNAIYYEKERQIKLIKEGKMVEQETRRWDDIKLTSFSMRSKEDSKDYRYFPEPDLMPLCLSEEWISGIKDSLPEFRDEKIKRYIDEYDIPEYDAGIITSSLNLSDIFEKTSDICNKPKKVSNWLMGETMRLANEQKMDVDKICFSPNNLAMLIDMLDEKVITGVIAKQIFEEIFCKDVNPREFAKKKQLIVVNDTNKLLDVIKEVINNNPKSVSDYHNGKTKAIGFLVGQTMKAMGGKANPSIVKDMIEKNI